MPNQPTTPSYAPSRRSFLSLGAGAAAAFAVAGAPATASAASRGGAEPPLRFGVIADCQYADKADRGVRLYRQSIGKLQEAVATLNEENLRFALHLGDFVDEFPESFDAVIPIWEQLRMSKHHVLGNHDFQMPREDVLATMKMPASYYHFRRNGWRFIVVDTNDISTYGNPEGSANYILAEQMRAELTAAGKPNGHTWNGGVSAEQLAWIEQTLKKARSLGEKVVLNSHHPVFPLDQHNAYNDAELVDLVTSYDNVVAWLNGHNHAGNYGFAGGTHFLTFKGMLDTTVNSFATVQAYGDRLVIDGFGREPDRVLPLGAPAYEG
jgi:manganese-dependent ADP-ribose/CDP-alcohol diphosphatase